MQKLDPAAQREAVAKRLSRSIGHLQSTLDQTRRGRKVADLAHQLHAVEAAIRAVKLDLVRWQMTSDLGAAELKRGTLSTLLTLARYL